MLAWTDLNPPSGSFLLVSIDANVSNVLTVGIKNLISLFTLESNESYRFQAGDPGGHQRCLLEEPGQPSPPDPPWMEPGWLSCTSISEEAHLGLSICLHPYGEAAVWSGATGSRFHLGPQQQHRLGSKVVAVTSWLGRVIQVAPFPHVSFYSGLISSYSTFTLQDRTRFSGRYRCSSH